MLDTIDLVWLPRVFRTHVRNAVLMNVAGKLLSSEPMLPCYPPVQFVNYISHSQSSFGEPSGRNKCEVPEP